MSLPTCPPILTKGSMTTAPEYPISRSAVPISCQGSPPLPGTRRLFSPVWKWPSSGPAVRIALPKLSSSMFIWNVSSITLTLGLPISRTNATPSSAVLRTCVDLHSNLRLGPVWVKSSTEIETGASFSLNLSANFVALSGESGLLFDRWLPGFDDGVGYALGAGRDGVNGEFVKDAKDACSNSVGYSHEMTQALRGQDGGAFERQAAQDRGDHFLKLFVTFPTWQDELVEPTRQLDVAGNRIARICDPQADQRCLELIAEMTEQLEDDPLFARATGEKVVNFVEDQHPHN